MRKKNGFTLIELLAIIVILAIIAVITIPILLNVIENSRKGSVIDSAYGFKDSINKWYISKLSSDRQLQLEGEYIIVDGKIKGNNINDENGVEIPISGTVPTSGTLTYLNNVLTGGCLVFGEYEVLFDGGSVIDTKKGRCIPKIESCPNCSYGYFVGDNGIDSTGQLVSGTVEDYRDVLKTTGGNSFLGFELNEQSRANKIYICGVNSVGKPFCLQSSNYNSDVYIANELILYDIFGEENCKVLGYNRLSCYDGYISAEIISTMSNIVNIGSCYYNSGGAPRNSCNS